MMLSLLFALAGLPPTKSPAPTISYEVRVDSVERDRVDVTMRLAGGPARLRLAMKTHQEYDAQFWKVLQFGAITGTADDHATSLTRRDSTLWDLVIPGGRGEIHYTLHLTPGDTTRRNAWRCTVRADGALLNSPDIFLYLPDFAAAPATVDLVIPRSWRIATALENDGRPTHLRAPNAAMLLDAPILLGALRQWSFTQQGTKFTVAYWPLPNATAIDTLRFVDGIKRLSGAAIDLFRTMPFGSHYHYLLQDGANDALEHRSSVTAGWPSADIARDPRNHLYEIAHEFVHTWNLVAIHPDTYGDLSPYKAPPTRGLWWGEGLTLYYADALQRRVGLIDSTNTRIDHLASLLSRYHSAAWSGRVSPEEASLAFGHSVVNDPNATGGYYLQGELIGVALDGAIRDSTRERRGLDDVMRALYAKSASGRGMTDAMWRATADSVCGCNLSRFFATQVSGRGPIDIGSAMARLGLRVVIDTILAVDNSGAPVPDTRLNMAGTDSVVQLSVPYASSAWARAGLRTGDVAVRMNGAPLRGFPDFIGQLRRARIGDRVPVEALRDGKPIHVDVTIAGYDRSRARIVDIVSPTADQLQRRARWLAGW
jgi:predicted metalloprotease with PDZ domain